MNRSDAGSLTLCCHVSPGHQGRRPSRQEDIELDYDDLDIPAEEEGAPGAEPLLAGLRTGPGAGPSSAPVADIGGEEDDERERDQREWGEGENSARVGRGRRTQSEWGEGGELALELVAMVVVLVDVMCSHPCRRSTSILAAGHRLHSWSSAAEQSRGAQQQQDPPHHQQREPEWFVAEPCEATKSIEMDVNSTAMMIKGSMKVRMTSSPTSEASTSQPTRVSAPAPGSPELKQPHRHHTTTWKLQAWSLVTRKKTIILGDSNTGVSSSRTTSWGARGGSLSHSRTVHLGTIH
ncbi:hypothetical protein F7725_014917 [Dissostichus mawsoni]|uniref:Uncharacterized protein n=1 Tax=Dissostichus mawsoni TaxID=36200 RepID=A0A7J5YGA2_DISMA|nr:hypothetical protein F7725_014917 [Dissostichus mawsoni]